MNVTLTPPHSASRGEGTPHATSTRRRPPGFTVAAGAFYCLTAGMHIGIVMTDAQSYGDFADGSPWAFVRDGWSEVFMANPAMWGLLVALGELALGVLMLAGGRAARLGWMGIILFQGLLVLFGWGYLIWSVPAALLFLLAARHDWPALSGARAVD